MRLFVALAIPEEVRVALTALVEKLRLLCQSARWARIEGLHVTLKFIGEVPPEKFGSIKTVLAVVPFPQPFQMAFRGLGFFPDESRPRVLWAGIVAGEAIVDLAAAVETALEPLGFARERREFSPHLTLARFDSPKDIRRLQEAIAAIGPLDFGGMVAREFHLYQSTLKRGGAEYTRLATFGSMGSQSR